KQVPESVMDIVQALKFLPENINAAKTSPLGVVCLFMSLVFLIILAFFIRERWPVKAGAAAGFCIFGLTALMIGNSRRVDAETPKPTGKGLEAQSPKPSGKVQDEDGQPVGNARVSIEPGGVPASVI